MKTSQDYMLKVQSDKITHIIKQDKGINQTDTSDKFGTWDCFLSTDLMALASICVPKAPPLQSFDAERVLENTDE